MVHLTPCEAGLAESIKPMEHLLLGESNRESVLFWCGFVDQVQNHWVDGVPEWRLMISFFMDITGWYLGARRCWDHCHGISWWYHFLSGWICWCYHSMVDSFANHFMRIFYDFYDILTIKERGQATRIKWFGDGSRRDHWTLGIHQPWTACTTPCENQSTIGYQVFDQYQQISINHHKPVEPQKYWLKHISIRYSSSNRSKEYTPCNLNVFWYFPRLHYVSLAVHPFSKLPLADSSCWADVRTRYMMVYEQLVSGVSQ